MKKQIITTLLIAMLLALTGCTAPQPGYYEKLTEAVNESTDSIIQALEVSEAVPKAKLEALDAKIDVIQDAALESAKAYDEKANEDKLGALIDAAIVGNKASAPLNPYAGPIGGVLAIVAGGYAAIQRKGKVVSDKKYRSHRQGVAAFMQKNEAPELYDEIGKARAKQGIT